jgi:acetyltransferase-like isoleucine patch superfamily enzyme
MSVVVSEGGKGLNMAAGSAFKRLGTMARNKVCKRLAQDFPLNAVRVWALRGAGYRVGKQVYIGEGFFVVDELDSNACNLTIGDRVAIAPRVMVVLASYPNNSRLRSELGETFGSVTIGDDAWIGAGAVLLPNATIGEQAIVATSAVVSGNVPSRVVAGGVPARLIRSLTPSPPEPVTPPAQPEPATPRMA